MQTNLARPFTTVDLTSGYFTLSGTYRSLVLSDKIHSLGTTPSSVPVVFRLVAASPEANGFYGSKGLSSRIPAAYTFLEKEFWKQVVAKSLHEPLKPDGGTSGIAGMEQVWVDVPPEGHLDLFTVTQQSGSPA